MLNVERKVLGVIYRRVLHCCDTNENGSALGLGYAAIIVSIFANLHRATQRHGHTGLCAPLNSLIFWTHSPSGRMDGWQWVAKFTLPNRDNEEQMVPVKYCAQWAKFNYFYPDYSNSRAKWCRHWPHAQTSLACIHTRQRWSCGMFKCWANNRGGTLFNFNFGLLLIAGMARECSGPCFLVHLLSWLAFCLIWFACSLAEEWREGGE